MIQESESHAHPLEDGILQGIVVVANRFEDVFLVEGGLHVVFVKQTEIAVALPEAQLCGRREMVLPDMDVRNKLSVRQTVLRDDRRYVGHFGAQIETARAPPDRVHVQGDKQRQLLQGDALCLSLEKRALKEVTDAHIRIQDVTEGAHPERDLRPYTVIAVHSDTRAHRDMVEVDATDALPADGLLRAVRLRRQREKEERQPKYDTNSTHPELFLVINY